MAKDDDALQGAIDGTEKEIFAAAFGKEELTLDESGDRDLESLGEGLEGRGPEDEEEADAPDEKSDEDAEPSDEPDKSEEPEAKIEVKTEPEPDPKGRVPAGRLREETEAKRAALAEATALKAQLAEKEAASQRDIAALNAKFDALLALQRQPAQPAQEPPKPEVTPDLYEDPKAFADHLLKGVESRFAAQQRAMRDREVNASIDAARERHGEAFSQAWDALSKLDKSPQTAAFVQRLEAAPNPGEAIISWHKRNVAARTVGNDIDAYNTRLREETRKDLLEDPDFRKEMMAKLTGEAMTGDNGKPRTETRLPKSLSRTAGGNTRAPNDFEVSDGSERAVFDAAWR